MVAPAKAAWRLYFVMKFINDGSEKLNNTIVTLGKFDGSHIGHQSLFSLAKKIKAKSDEELFTVVFTFDINPRQVCEDSYESLCTNAERMNLEENLGMDYVYIWPFTKENMAMEPEVFVQRILAENLGVKHIIVGGNFRFGRERRGDAALLRSLQETFGFCVHIVPEVTYKGEVVSSTLIKREILAGNMEDAAYMLGAPFSVSGKVVPGKHLGKSLGFPTINFEAPKGKILPPNGVYATKTIIGGKSFLSMTNIGTRPTFEEGALRNIETNIFDFSGDIYGENARVEFYRFIRPEMHFESPSDLIEEIKRNKIQIKEFFKNQDEKHVWQN